MQISPTLRIAIRSLRANKMRSLLTMLGIVIGVASVITMVAVGEGAQVSLAKSIASLGSNLIMVRPGSATSGGAHSGSGGVTTLTEEDAEAIERECRAIAFAAPEVRGQAQVVNQERNWSTSVTGTNESYLYAREWVVERGRFINRQDMDGKTKVCVLGQTVVKELFGDEDPVGKLIRVKRMPFKVVGVLQEKGQTPHGDDQDDIVVIPLTTAQTKLLGITHINSIMARGVSADSLRDGEEQITALLHQRHRIQEGGEDDFRVRNLTEMLAMAETQTKVMTLLLGAVASISLIVGGIGIMNIMLVTVTERTREIGIRMAVGAKQADILLQFLVEALVLSVIGGGMGVLFGIGLSFVVGPLSGGSVDAVVGITPIMLAVGFSAGIGIFFGFYPARKASMLEPIVALRYE